jgi:CheY-like chemotaxis protein
MATSIAADRENGGMSETEPEARLLVVEDEPNILELLSASLRLAGFEVARPPAGWRPSRPCSVTAPTWSSWT